MTGSELFVILPRYAEAVAPVLFGELTGASLVLSDSSHPQLRKDELLYRVTSSEEGAVFGIGAYMHYAMTAQEYKSTLPFEDAYVREMLLGDYLSDKARSHRNAELWHAAVESLLSQRLTPSVGIVHTVMLPGDKSVRFYGRDEYALSDADAILLMKLPPDRIAHFSLAYGI